MYPSIHNFTIKVIQIGTKVENRISISLEVNVNKGISSVYLTYKLSKEL